MDIYCTTDERYIQAIEELRYGEAAKSLRLFNELLLADPGYARAYFQVGILNYYYTQDYQAAGYYFGKCIELEPGFPEAYQEFLKLLVFLNMKKKAGELASQALKVPGMERSFIYQQLGLLEEKNQDDRKALDLYRKAYACVLEKEEADNLKEAIGRVKEKLQRGEKFVYSC
ncbi:hypothetical protein [Pedobacter sp. SYSU D00535]|uniref:hypothetical protein n=1 Tax=Pedobacter sp. SYSU D00535 TaxID=2810308 RepID=UPI001A96A41F|nr:hypothetical protein [Pedobacter sp. SYSU D00535]